MRVILFRLVLALGTGLGACNTVHGFGKDLEKVGGKISAKSEREQH